MIEILGHPDDFGVDVEIVIRKHHLPHQFPPEVMEQAQAMPAAIAEAELAGPPRFPRHADIVTIDGETARDFDDAVWVDRLPNGNYALHVHIADVSHYVRPGTPIDLEARLRGTSVYFPDRAVPMLPFELSTNLCSLRPARRTGWCSRRCWRSIIRARWWRRSSRAGVIRSVERMTYTNVHLLLEGDAALRERYQPLVERFELMQELALMLNRKRVRRGSIDFDLPEPLIEFDELGAMTGVTRAPRNIAHRLIEEFMLAANESGGGAPGARRHRLHLPHPRKARSEARDGVRGGGRALRLFARRRRDSGEALRLSPTSIATAARSAATSWWPDSGLRISSRHYQKLVAKIEGKPEERILSYLMLRSLKQARYSTENVGHFALAADTYTHFTSPIRRYPDLMVHRLLRAVLTGKPTPGEEYLKPLADECSQSERRAADAERELVEWKKVKFMTERVGEDFDALIISTAKYGLFVELTDLFVEGLVPIDTLPGDRVHLSGERPQDRGQAHAPRIFHRRQGARHSGPRGRQRTQAAVLDIRR